jgi:hypothetical protein
LRNARFVDAAVSVPEVLSESMRIVLHFLEQRFTEQHGIWLTPNGDAGRPRRAD